MRRICFHLRLVSFRSSNIRNRVLTHVALHFTGTVTICWTPGLINGSWSSSWSEDMDIKRPAPYGKTSKHLVDQNVSRRENSPNDNFARQIVKIAKRSIFWPEAGRSFNLLAHFQWTANNVEHTMTRYTNVGRKRTYLQASFDPNDNQVALNAPSTSALGSHDASRSLHESNADAPPESSRKRRRKSKENFEKSIAESAPAAVAAGDSEKSNSPVTKSEKTKKALTKLKAKERAKRLKKSA